MLFNSVDFLWFFIIVTTLYFTIPFRFRWGILLVASCYFYMFFKPEYILILFGTIIVDYFAGILIEQEANPRRKKNYLAISLLANIGVLAIFKYYNFINDNITGIYTLWGGTNPIPALTMLLPIGLSFHTFQAMSYTIEVYRGNQRAERHFGIYALYVMFYPQLVAGPIERPQNVLHQFHEEKFFNYDNALWGLNLIAWGLFKKVVIADRVAVYVNEVYGHLDQANSLSVLLAMIFFSVQIYCDFSGYSDIARGTARFMGYDLMVNFNRPYMARSIPEFWSRWHISLSTWFKDYLYIPLGGNRVSRARWYQNLVIVFLVSGLWHGANWTFIIWGGLHGLYQVVAVSTQTLRSRYLDWWSSTVAAVWLDRAVVFALVSVAWVFFRAKSVDEAFRLFGVLLRGDFSTNMAQLTAGKGPLSLLFSAAMLVLLMAAEKLPADMRFKSYAKNIIFLTISIFLIIILGKNTENEFIYFQF